MLRRAGRAAGACLAIALLCLAPTAPAVAQVVPGCGSLENAFGPFDYRDPAARGYDLHIVESYHFTPEVATLTHGSTGTIIQDLDYTLRAFPNHYAALADIARYALRGGQFLEQRPAECYFKRAMAFRPDDANVRVIYGNYLFECIRLKGDLARRKLQCGGFEDPKYMDPQILQQARSQYEAALKLAPASPDVNYNAGLFYLDVGELDTAKRLADVAYRGGYPLMGLKKMLAAAEERQRMSRRPGAAKAH